MRLGFVQALADLAAIFAEDPNAMIQGTNAAPAPALGFEEPPQLPGALRHSAVLRQCARRVALVMPKRQPTLCYPLVSVG